MYTKKDGLKGFLTGIRQQVVVCVFSLDQSAAGVSLSGAERELQRERLNSVLEDIDDYSKGLATDVPKRATASDRLG